MKKIKLTELKQTSIPVISDEQKDLYYYLIRVSKDNGLNVFLPLKVFSTSKDFKLYLKHSNIFLDYIKKYFSGISKVKRTSLIIYLIELVLKVIEQQGKEIRPRIVLFHLGGIKKVIDNQFPGYRENKLLMKLV